MIIARVNSNPNAYFLCGMLLEKQKLLNGALKFYEKLIFEKVNNLLKLILPLNLKIIKIT